MHDVLAEVAARFHDVALVATREAERRAELAGRWRPHVLDVRRRCRADVHDLGGLLDVVGLPASTWASGRAGLRLVGPTGSGRLGDRLASLAALVRDNTTLDREQVSHLNRLMSEWGMLADFCFSDLLLYVPTKDDRWLIVGQVRPATGQTVYHTDWVGTFANVSEQVGADVVAHVGGDHRGRRRGRGAAGPGADAGRSPVRCNGPTDRRADPRVGAASGRAAGRARARRTSRIFDRFAGDDRRGLVPVPGARRPTRPPRRASATA